VQTVRETNQLNLEILAEKLLALRAVHDHPVGQPRCRHQELMWSTSSSGWRGAGLKLLPM
jgi:hypothetical protein